jgi:2'-hydroxyisoflavone reductase
MRILVLGGTIFVGYAVAAEALRRGHDVVCAARGESGSVPAGATLVRVDRDAEDGLGPLSGQSFDAVVNVYADERTPGLTPANGPLVPALREHSTREEMMARGEDGVLLYGGIKVASENAVREVMGERAFVVRPGLITGSWDRSDRFGYWPGRFARGGRVLVPDAPDQPIQYHDVRDLARWIVDAGEKGLAGTYDGIGPHRPLTGLLDEIAAAVGTDVELVRTTSEQLVTAGVNPWTGPRSLPMWLPAEDHGAMAHDPTPSIEAGMPVRPLAETVADALERERELGLDRERKAGLSPAEEKEILAKL